MADEESLLLSPTPAAPAHARRWLLLDWPQPWPRDAKQIEALAALRAALKPTRTRLQLVVPPPDPLAHQPHEWRDYPAS